MHTHFVNMKGTRCPKCMAADDGPRPVYRKNGFFCSARSRILLKSLQGDKIININQNSTFLNNNKLHEPPLMLFSSCDKLLFMKGTKQRREVVRNDFRNLGVDEWLIWLI